MRGVRQHFAFVHERIFQRLPERVVRTVVGIGLTESKQATAIVAAQRSEQIIEADADEAGTLNQIYNRAQALTDGDIGDSECLMNARLRRDHIAHPIVLETDNSVRNLVQPSERLLRLRAAAFALERRWDRGEGDDELACSTSEQRRQW